MLKSIYKFNILTYALDEKSIKFRDCLKNQCCHSAAGKEFWSQRCYSAASENLLFKKNIKKWNPSLRSGWQKR